MPRFRVEIERGPATLGRVRVVLRQAAQPLSTNEVSAAVGCFCYPELRKLEALGEAEKLSVAGMRQVYWRCRADARR